MSDLSPYLVLVTTCCVVPLGMFVLGAYWQKRRAIRGPQSRRHAARATYVTDD